MEGSNLKVLRYLFHLYPNHNYSTEHDIIHSQVLQDCVKRVKLAFDRWFNADKNGPRLGKPRFKGKGRYPSFTYPQIKSDCIPAKIAQIVVKKSPKNYPKEFIPVITVV